MKISTEVNKPRASGRCKVSLDLHDFSIINNRLDLLLKLKAHFPGFKVSLFTVPNDTRQNWGLSSIRSELLMEIKKHLDWVQIIPHGLTHKRAEMKHCSYNTFKNSVLPSIVSAFNKEGLPFEKGFCAPHWKWNADVIRALDEAGWWGAINRNEPAMLTTKKFYRYTHAIDEYFSPAENILKLHGHLYGTRNDLGRCLDNLLTLPKNIEWHFVTDFLERSK